MAFLFGAVVIVTGPTVIIPLLRTVRPNTNISNVLRWEGIVIDPLCALLAVLVFDFIISSQIENAVGSIFFIFAKIVIIGTTIGTSIAIALGNILKRHLVPEYLRYVLTLTLVVSVYAISDAIEYESGLLAVTIMGMMLTNMKDMDIDDILNFKESLRVLLISGLFIILAARIEIQQFMALGWPALGIVFVVMCVALPLSVLVSTIGSNLIFKETTAVLYCRKSTCS